MTSTRRTVGKGVFYTALGKYSNIFFSILIGAILARLLSPDEFGIVAIVTVFVTFFNILTDFGIGPAVVQNQQLDKKDVSSIFSFSIILGFIFAGVFFFLATPIANFYNREELIDVSRLLSIAILFYSLQVIPNALNQKALKFKQIGIINVVVQVSTGIIAIILAYKGFSYYALIIRSILNSLLTFIIFYWLMPVKIAFHIHWHSIGKIARFSGFQFLFNFINYFSRNADNLLIGKYFGTASLGYYDKSYRLMTMPVQNLTHVITPVLMPVLSKYQDDKQRIFNNYLKVVKLLGTIGLPLSVFLYFAANEIILLLYGSQWGQSIPVFKILALTVGIQMVLSSTGSIFQAVNRTDLLFISGLLSAIFMVGGIYYGVFIGKNLESVGYGLIVAFTINFFQTFYFLINRVLKTSFWNFLNAFLLPVVIALILIPVNYLVSLLSIKSMIISLIVKFIASLFVFSILYFSSPERRNEFITIIRNARKNE